MPKQYWVIGGDYSNLEFHNVIEGTTRIYGPFGSFDDARSTWFERSQASRSAATTRYTIVSSVPADR